MREDVELAKRLAKLQGGSSASRETAGADTTKGLQERLEALSGVDRSTAGEEDFNSRLSALSEGGNVSSADDLAARFGRLATSGVGGGASAPSASAQQYDVPEVGESLTKPGCCFFFLLTLLTVGDDNFACRDRRCWASHTFYCCTSIVDRTNIYMTPTAPVMLAGL